MTDNSRGLTQENQHLLINENTFQNHVNFQFNLIIVNLYNFHLQHSGNKKPSFLPQTGKKK